MKVLSLFSGVGGFDLGLERAGMETVFQCEWDKHATKILEKHWPHVPRWTDVSTLTGEHILNHAPVIDVVAWGSPCQDLSVAGKRAGLQGARSGLFHEGVRIIKELRELTNGKYPRISIWENVAGALSSGKGADFGQVLTEMDEAGACFSEWRILDAQYFGVPQRRRRVFLISVFDTATAARCPDPLLPVSESVRRDTETGNTARQEPAGTIANCLRVGSGVGERGDGSDNLITTGFGSGSYGGWTETDTAITLSARDHSGNTVAVESFTPSQFANYTEGVGTVRANGGELGGGSETLVTFTKGKRPQTSTDDETWDENRPAPTLNAFDQGDTRATTIIAFASNQRAEVRDLEDRAVALSAEPGTNQQTYIAFENSYRDAARIATEGITNTLSAKMGTGGNNTPMVAFPIQDGREMEKYQNGIGVADNGTPAYTLDQTGAQAVAYSVREDAKANTFSATELDRANALSALRPSPQSHHAQMFIAEQPTMAVRRLTPLECERLMGWPDDWTAGQSDTHRYKQCGNGVASPVATWIAQQLLQLDKEPANATQTENPTT